MSKYIPNSFQTPNALVDELMPLLTDPEWRVLCFMVRHILGWRDTVDNKQARISLSCFTGGFRGYPGCGLHKGTILSALDGLIEFRLVAKVGKSDARGQMWKLTFDNDDVDLEGLRKRKAEKGEKAQKRTQKARDKKLTVSGLSDRPAEEPPQVVSGTDQKQSVGQTDGSLSDRLIETHSETHLETQIHNTALGSAEVRIDTPSDISLEEKDNGETPEDNPPPNSAPPPPTDHEIIVSLIDAWINSAEVIQPSAYGNKTIRAQALEMHKRGVTPEYIRQYIQFKREDPFWKTKEIDWAKVAGEILPYMKFKGLIPTANSATDYIEPVYILTPEEARNLETEARRIREQGRAQTPGGFPR